MKRFFALVFIMAAALTITQCRNITRAPMAPEPLLSANRSVIQVNVTRQRYNFHFPWQQRRSSNRIAIGVVMPEGTVLVTAQPIADHRYIELEKLDTREKSRAAVVEVDYEANLALLKPEDKNFLADRKPMDISSGAAQGDALEIWRIKSNGDVVADNGTLVSVELAAYPYQNALLAFKLSTAGQYRFNYATLPVIKAGRLAGFLMRYDTRSQSLDVIPEPVIRHFIADAGDGRYEGFPKAGFRFSQLSDPQLRRFEKIPDDMGGIYVQQVVKDGPADKAGLKQGDVITHMGDVPVTQYGRYIHPSYGRISIQHLIQCDYQVGETLPMRVFRNGQTREIKVVLDHRKPGDYLVPPYAMDQPPRYIIVGGLVMLELTAEYLKEYGADWTSNAPIHLLNYLNQDDTKAGGREKIVILSSVIPTAGTIGFESLADLVVTRINDQDIYQLDDVVNALKKPVNGFHKVAFEQHPKVIFLDPEALEGIHSEIRERYGIPDILRL